MNESPRSATKLEPAGSLCIEKASALRADILKSFAQGDSVEFDFTGVEEIDLACVQVLFAAKRESRKIGVAFRLTGQLSPRISRRLAASGFVPSSPKNGESLERSLVGWQGE